MQVIEICPLGKRCTEEVDGNIERCKWYMCFRVTDQNGKIGEDWQCAQTWIPVLQAELLEMMRLHTKETTSNEKSSIIHPLV